MGYVVAATPRSGSWLLCELLASTGIAGRPGEYGCLEDTATWRDHYRCASHVEHFFRFPDLMRSPNGVFGVKLMWPQWSCLGADARRYLGRPPDAYGLLNALAGPIRVLRLRRRDSLRQAVSLARAQQTGRWSQREGDIVQDDPTYDAAAVRSAYETLRWQSSLWDRDLSELPVPVLELDYESMVSDMEGVLREVLGFLGLPSDTSWRRPLLRRQADQRTEYWVARARLDLPFNDSFHPFH